LLRKMVAAVILVPLAAVIVAFAVANRQEVTLSFDPFDPSHPAYSQTMWLFVPIFVALILGVMIGGTAAWLRQGRWRGAARRLERQAQAMRRKVEAFEGTASAPTIVPERRNSPQRLQLKPPVQ
jgi:uncharacterized integral membrane protein